MKDSIAELKDQNKDEKRDADAKTDPGHCPAAGSKTHQQKHRGSENDGPEVLIDQIVGSRGFVERVNSRRSIIPVEAVPVSMPYIARNISSE